MKPSHRPPPDATECRSCGRWVRWARTERGLWQPFNAFPSEEGSFVLVEIEALDGSKTLSSRYHPLPEGIEADGWTRYMPHHATCPQAPEWREKARERAREAMRRKAERDKAAAT